MSGILHLIRHHSDHDEWLRKQVIAKVLYSLTMASDRHRFCDEHHIFPDEARAAIEAVEDMPLEYITDRPLSAGIRTVDDNRRDPHYIAAKAEALR